jgi:hypothetical protein
MCIDKRESDQTDHLFYDIRVIIFFLNKTKGKIT